MNIRQASYVLAILQEGSISAAAKRLYISQPALSQTLRLSEEALGAQIFQRGTTPLALTYAGEKYVKAARQMMTINNNLQNEIAEINNEEYGRLRFGISTQLTTQLLPVILPPFMEKYPHVDIIIAERGIVTIEELAVAGGVDIVLVSTDSRHSELEYIPIEKMRLVLLADKRTEIAKNYSGTGEIGIETAKNEEFISLKLGSNHRGMQGAIFAAAGINPRVAVEAYTYETAEWLTVTCHGVMICPDVYIDVSSGILDNAICIPLKETGLERHFYICHRRDLYLTRYMKDWISLLIEKYGEVTAKRCLKGDFKRD